MEPEKEIVTPEVAEEIETDIGEVEATIDEETE
jgi:hypothetical protein